MSEHVQVTVNNILQVQPLDLAYWISQNVLDIRLPQTGPNHTLNIQGEVIPLIVDIGNKLALTTELYVVCVGAKAPWSANKKNPDMKAQAEQIVTIIGAHVDILYRTLQTLESLRESASRLITASNNVNRIYGS